LLPNRTKVGNACPCQPGYVEISLVCVPCDPKCLTCVIDTVTCSNCVLPRVYNGTTKNCDCPNLYYYENGSNCLACDPTCQDCSGPLVNNCTVCDASLHRVYDVSANKCLCDSGYF